MAVSNSVIKDINKLSLDQYLDSSLTLENANDLKLNCIIPLLASSQKKHTAKYHCTICNYYCHTMDAAFKHKRNQTHAKYFKVIKMAFLIIIFNLIFFFFFFNMFKSEKKLRELSIPKETSLEALTNYLTNIYVENCLNQEELNYRFEVFFKIKRNYLCQHSGRPFIYLQTVN